MNAKRARALRRARAEGLIPVPEGRRPSSIARTVSPLGMLGKDDPRLRVPVKELVTEADEEELLPLLPRLAATCRARQGLALALPQVGLMYRAVVTTDAEGRWILVVNPHFDPRGVATELGLEGCLSLPGRWYLVERHVEGYALGRIAGTKEAQRFRCEGLEARMWQHELDHLNGKLICDDWPESGTTAVLPTGALERLAQHAGA